MGGEKETNLHIQYNEAHMEDMHTNTLPRGLCNPYENTIRPKWISRNWFQIARSRGKGDTGHYYTKLRGETRMFTQAFFSYVNSQAEITEEKKRQAKETYVNSLTPFTRQSVFRLNTGVMRNTLQRSQR